ncbi:hypothetical protein Amsp01_051280 [Amycolatopsis sp. NBRC 101858]|uniref:hypothetical protein n=1 Tax=Amycolatopsis sp. NBRC 101858 TaxID=3032200 RepID=UPI0024A18F34|nr:hypothetical protein [Amycolatopsis sp. NBRC 101858]GLY39104.1 hypothetical protein Amsp01_051280 [Amycolatopsis sp. NBRC 101858]
MDSPGRELRLPLDEAVEVLCDLNEFVVSLDRIGSRQAGGAADDETMGRFVADWDLAGRLARARRRRRLRPRARLRRRSTLATGSASTP